MPTNSFTIDRLCDDLAANPEMIDSLLKDKFDLDSFMKGAGELGYGMSDDEIEGYLEKKYPNGSAAADMKFYVSDAENGGIRELSSEEAESVGGGFAMALAVVVVAGFAYVVAVVITLAVGFTAAAAAAMALAVTVGI